MCSVLSSPENIILGAQIHMDTTHVHHFLAKFNMYYGNTIMTVITSPYNIRLGRYCSWSLCHAVSS